MISSKGEQISIDVTPLTVFYCVRHTVSYCNLEEIWAESGVIDDHATFNRRLRKYWSLIANNPRRHCRTSIGCDVDVTTPLSNTCGNVAIGAQHRDIRLALI